MKLSETTDKIINYLYNNGYLIIDNEKTHKENLEIIKLNINMYLADLIQDLTKFKKLFK